MSRARSKFFRYLSSTLGGVLAIWALTAGGQGRASTTLSLTQTSYDADDRPVCTAVRLNLATTATDACTPGPQGGNDPDRISRTLYDPDSETIEIRRAVGTPDEQVYATYTYTHNGQKASESDANGNVTRMTYDSFNHLQYLFYPSPSVTRTAQPCAATPETWCNGLQPYTARTTGAATAPALGVANTADYEQYGYDANDNRIMWRRRDGQTINFTYDNLNREVISDAPGTALDIYTAYDLLGHVRYKHFGSASGPGVSYVYDVLGRITSTTDMNGRTLTYAYNQASARTMMWYPDGNSVGYTLDGLNRATAIGYDAYSGLTSQTYDDLGRLTAIGKNGGSTSYSYDAMGRVISMANDLNGTGYDVSWSFAYNAASQITSLTSTNAAYDYKETAISTVNQTYDGLNRDTAIAALTGGYDLRGNMTYDGVRTFTYDIYNRLLTATGTGANLSLTYDPEGRLASYTSGATVTQFLYDGVKLIGEYDGSGAVLRRYIFGTGTDDPLAWYEGAGTSDLRYMYTNYQGSVIAYANSAGVLQNLYKYGPYGEPKDINDNDSWSGIRFGYTGQMILPEARLYYYKARVYDPKYGRFLQTDPIGTKDDEDMYAYTGDDPINRADPTGLAGCGKSVSGAACRGWEGVKGKGGLQAELKLDVSRVQKGLAAYKNDSKSATGKEFAKAMTNAFGKNALSAKNLQKLGKILNAEETFLDDPGTKNGGKYDIETASSLGNGGQSLPGGSNGWTAYYGNDVLVGGDPEARRVGSHEIIHTMADFYDDHMHSDRLLKDGTEVGGVYWDESTAKSDSDKAEENTDNWACLISGECK